MRGLSPRSLIREMTSWGTLGMASTCVEVATARIVSGQDIVNPAVISELELYHIWSYSDQLYTAHPHSPPPR